jgi:hypothetical protein
VRSPPPGLRLFVLRTTTLEAGSQMAARTACALREQEAGRLCPVSSPLLPTTQNPKSSDGQRHAQPAIARAQCATTTFSPDGRLALKLGGRARRLRRPPAQVDA